MMTRVNASVSDRAASSAPGCFLVGPLRLRSVESIEATLRQIAERGPSNRVGLHPSTARKWMFDPASPVTWTVSRGADTFDPADADAVLMEIANSPLTATIVIRLLGDYVLLAFDHGLGGGHFMNAITAVLVGDEAEAIAKWPRVNTTRPTISALRHTIRGQRAELTKGVADVVAKKFRAGIPDRYTTRTKVTMSQIYTSGSSAPGYSTAFRNAVSSSPAPSFVSMIIVALTKGLRRHGIALQPTAGVLVDLSRYLPKGAVTLANFTSMVYVSTDDGISPHRVDEQLRAELSSCRPLIAYVLVEMSRIVPDLGPWDIAGSTGARLIISDNPAHALVKEYACEDPTREPIHMAAQPLQYRDQISILLSRLPDGRVQIGVSFFKDAFDVAAIRQTLDDVLSDPVATVREVMS